MVPVFGRSCLGVRAGSGGLTCSFSCTDFFVSLSYCFCGEGLCVYSERVGWDIGWGHASVGGLCFFAVLTTVLFTMAGIVTRGTGFGPTGLGKV